MQKYLKSYITDRVLKLRHKEVFAKKSYLVDNQGIKVCLTEAVHLALARSAGVIVAYPLSVVSTRQMVEAIELHGASCSLIHHLFAIMGQNGVSGLFSGVAFRVGEEVLTVLSVAMFLYLLNNYILPEECDQQMRQFVPLAAGFLVSNITHPFTVVATTMALSHGNFKLVPTYSSSLKCFRSLLKAKQLERGISTFFRYVSNGPY
ncbi:hypothetical protein Ciccas_011760 [Cichlidogyrus casuarinus]|uniref:Uncharacterized protein n=1 Tax=Cichlidogyrus casuarinus TaxID=1844966 RepID=A0ABD2PQB0_9PLAT